MYKLGVTITSFKRLCEDNFYKTKKNKHKNTFEQVYNPSWDIII